MAPQSGWTDKDERQYEHIKQSELERGESEDRASEIAARTVNKHRSEEGRTLEQQRGGGGNKKSSSGGGGSQELSELTKDELYARAKSLGIECRSTMNKDELLRAIRKHSS